jgi:hypothetical protein
VKRGRVVGQRGRLETRARSRQHGCAHARAVWRWTLRRITICYGLTVTPFGCPAPPRVWLRWISSAAVGQCLLLRTKATRAAAGAAGGRHQLHVHSRKALQWIALVTKVRGNRRSSSECDFHLTSASTRSLMSSTDVASTFELQRLYRAHSVCLTPPVCVPRQPISAMATFKWRHRRLPANCAANVPLVSPTLALRLDCKLSCALTDSAPVSSACCS